MLYVMKKDKSTKKIAYSAVLVSISVVVILISAFTPMQIVPLVFVSLALYNRTSDYLLFSGYFVCSLCFARVCYAKIKLQSSLASDT